MKRIGVDIIKVNGNEVRRWSSNEIGDVSSANTWQYKSYEFDSGMMSCLNGAAGMWVIKGIYLWFSTEGGTGSRQTTIDISHFALHYDMTTHTPPGARWILPSLKTGLPTHKSLATL